MRVSHAPVTISDPLNQAEGYVYDGKHNLVRKTDRKGLVTRHTYDVLERLASTTQADGSTIGISYDTANRPTQLADGANIVQELAGSASNNGNPANAKASYVSGDIDEVFAQQSGSWTGATTLTYLTDALGSTVWLVDAAGARVVNYTYDRYSNTSADAAVDNAFQYMGRENDDGTGLH